MIERNRRRIVDPGCDGDGGNVLVLGGGGARGFAHFGVLRVLEDAGITIDRIIGVSIGAFVGALYCQNPDIRATTARVREYVTSDRFVKFYERMTKASRKRNQAWDPSADQPEGPVDEKESQPSNGAASQVGLIGKLKDYLKATVAFHRFVMNQAILSNRPMEDCLEAVAENCGIESLEIPLTIVAADLRRGERVRIEEGDLFSAVVGSTALPGIFPPVERENALLTDYGVLCSIPVSTALRYQPRCVIAVDLTPEMPFRESFSSGLEIVNRMEEIGCYLFKEHISAYADVIVKPEVSGVDWSDFHDMDTVVEKGVAATESVLPTLLRATSSVPYSS